MDCSPADASAAEPPSLEGSATPPPGLLLIISGPSGVGKTTITHAVEKQIDAVFSVSMTTRPRTARDVEGVDYLFVSKEEFRRCREAGELLEFARVFDHDYGTPRRPVARHLAAGKTVLLEIDVEGAGQVKRSMPGCFAIFIEPPNEQTLLERLRGRKREDEQAIRRRFARARQEVTLARTSGIYDAFVVNDDLDVAVSEAAGLVRAELTRRRGMQADA